MVVAIVVAVCLFATAGAKAIKTSWIDFTGCQCALGLTSKSLF